MGVAPVVADIKKGFQIECEVPIKPAIAAVCIFRMPVEK